MTEEQSIDWSDFIQKLPEELRPLAEKYATGLTDLTTKEICAWIDLVLSGDTKQARLTAFRRLSADDLLSAGDSILDDWQSANEENAQQVEAGRQAGRDILRTCLFLLMERSGIPLVPA